MPASIPARLPGANSAERSRERPTQAFLICSDDLRVVHSSNSLAGLLRLSPEIAAYHGDIVHLFAASASLDAAARLAIATRLDQARIDQAGCAFDIVSGVGAPLVFAVEIQKMGGAHWIISFDDLSARQEAEARVVSLTLTDALTGLGNRLHFRHGLNAALRSTAEGPPSVALILIDLDRFKTVNDTLGHPVGDELLCKVAGRLRTAIRQTDMLARLGGDEFAAWIPSSIGSEALARLAARIIDLLSRPFLIDGMQVNIGASVGIAIAPQDGETYEALVKTADLALYSSKALGRGTFSFFDAEMERRAHERRSVEIDLRRALALRQFELHYRPQIDVDTGRLTALEALLRWRHPERDLLEPASFMAIAEEIGLASQLGHWVIEMACQQAATWPERIKLTLSVSTHQFEAGSLVEGLRAALAVSALPPQRLQLEITESVLLRNAPNIVKTLFELRALGVGIGISNFGTGYASLTTLDSFPFDRIRMDSALIQGDAVSHRAIINAVVAFGASLGVSTMVDGIRSEAEWAEIGAGRGTFVQGLLSVDPLAPPELDHVIRELDGTPNSD